LKLLKNEHENLLVMNQVEEIKRKLFQILDYLRGNVRIEDRLFILYFLILYHKNIISEVDIKDHKDAISQNINKKLNDYSGDLKWLLESISIDIEKVLEQLSNQAQYEVFNILFSCDKKVIDENISDIFDYLLYKLTLTQGRMSGESILPYEISKFIMDLIDLPENSKVYNPFAGLASFGVLNNKAHKYYGQEIHQITWAYGVLRLIAHDKMKSSVYSLGDSIKSWNPLNESYDLIIGNPPFKLRNFTYDSAIVGNVNSLEEYMIVRGIDNITNQGQILSIVSNSFLSSATSEYKLRKYLLDTDILDTIISFPGGLLKNTAIPFSAILINNDKKIKDCVRFIDTKYIIDPKTKRDKKLDLNKVNLNSDGFPQKSIRLISNQEIIESDYNLDYRRYFLDGTEGVRLSSCATIIKGKRLIRGRKGKFIRIRDLKNDKLDFNLILEEVEDKEITGPVYEISESCLLIATRWESMKPTYFEFKGVPILVSQDIVALKVNEEVINIEYLINELYAESVLKQVEAYRYGVTVKTLAKKDLLNLQLIIPELNEQVAKIKGVREGIAKQKEKDLVLFKRIYGLENEINEQNSYLRHVLAGPASNLSHAYKNMMTILYSNVFDKNPKVLQLKVSEKHPNTLERYFEIIGRDIEKITVAVSSKLNVSTRINNTKLKPIEITSFLRQYVDEISENGDKIYDIKFEIDEESFLDSSGDPEPAYILGNESLLRDLLNNAISNAVVHAFSPKRNNRIEVFLIRDTDVESENELQILISNSGNPIPPGFSFKGFVGKGTKFGVNAGEGFGGWYIYEIIKKLSGSLGIIDETGPEGLPETDLATSLEINFPIINYYDE